MRARQLRIVAAAIGLGALATGCTAEPGSTSGASGAGTTTTITVFAAASLTDAFSELGEAFSAANPGTTVTLNVAGSSSLAAQIAEGAPADVFAAADLDSVARLSSAGALDGAPRVFATNRIQIIVAPGNPAGIGGLADLADPELILVACAATAACGRYTQQVLERAGVTVGFASLEENVRAVVSKVTLGEADAGIVYATDVIAADDIADAVDIPAEWNVVVDHPIAITAAAPNPSGAEAFVDFVLSDAGQSILESYGFAAP